jgi:outer membrane protein assembly factor BamB
VPSPLVHDGHVYLVKNGGIVTCLDARNGEKRFEGRLGALGEYYASPVAGDGKVYLASQSGTVVVLAAGTTLDVIARNDLGEPIMATPAIVDGKLYVRTEGHLYAFGQ